MQTDYHNPVMLEACMEGLAIDPSGTYCDLTFGGGGHSKVILSRLTTGKLFGFDQDEDAKLNAPNDPNLIFVQSNFRYLKRFLTYYKSLPVDGILADLGVSSHHFDDDSRGFSFRFDGELDMRMNKHCQFDAKHVLNTYSEEELKVLFRLYGEVNRAGLFASMVTRERVNRPYKTIQDFKDVIGLYETKTREKKMLAKAFQAVRIEVNSEMKVLEEALTQAVEVLKPGGRLVIMSYHSLEDRMVKNFIRSGNVTGDIEKDFYGNVLSPLEALNRKVIIPTMEEQEENPRSRSAKLRIAIKK